MSQADADFVPIAVEVRRGAPTDEELAALVAVVSEAYAREARSAVADDEPATTTWSRARRSLRSPLRRDLPFGGFVG